MPPLTKVVLGKEPTMFTCRICHFATELDDVVLAQGVGQCFCLTCYDRATGSTRPMPRALQRQVSAALAEREAAQ